MSNIYIRLTCHDNTTQSVMFILIMIVVYTTLQPKTAMDPSRVVEYFVVVQTPSVTG